MVRPLVPPAPTTIPPAPPHPYQIASYHSSPTTRTNPYPHSSPVRYAGGTTAPYSDGESGGSQIYIIHHHHHHYVQNPPSSSSTVYNRRNQLGRYLKLRPLILLVLFLPIPPLLSLLYVVIGHAILRRSSPTSLSWTASLLSSANAGATGGIILAVPLFLLLFLLLFPVPRQYPPREAQEDFFEDDESQIGTTSRVRKYVAYTACVILTLCVGCPAGALGVTCLAGGEGMPNSKNLGMLTPGNAAEAGIVGGAVLWGASATILALGAWGRFFWNRLAQTREKEEERASG